MIDLMYPRANFSDVEQAVGIRFELLFRPVPPTAVNAATLPHDILNPGSNLPGFNLNVALAQVVALPT